MLHDNEGFVIRMSLLSWTFALGEEGQMMYKFTWGRLISTAFMELPQWHFTYQWLWPHFHLDGNFNAVLQTFHKFSFAEPSYPRILSQVLLNFGNLLSHRE